MNVFWKTFLGGMLCIALLFGGRYAKAWIANHTYRADRVERVERQRLDYERQRLERERQMVAQTYYAAPRSSQSPSYGQPIKPPAFYTPPHRPPNYTPPRRNHY